MEQIELRIYDATAHGAATVVYLPGLHGDWTLIGSFRRALAGRVRFVEMTYPRTLTWSLEEYAAGIESALATRGIQSGWVLAESFGSQVAWPLVARGHFRTEGLILAGGFVQHPVSLAVRLGKALATRVPVRLIRGTLSGYGRIARRKLLRSPEVRHELEEFLARRTEEDQKAIQHRLHLISRSDAATLARQVHVPVYALTGMWDPIVPWFPVRRWLRRNCPALRAHRVIRHSDHNVLGNAPEAAAQQVLEWIDSERRH